MGQTAQGDFPLRVRLATEPSDDGSEGMLAIQGDAPVCWISIF